MLNFKISSISYFKMSNLCRHHLSKHNDTAVHLKQVLGIYKLGTMSNYGNTKVGGETLRMEYNMENV